MSNLLSQASLVMIPSGYKEDVVYSQIPTNGNGDLSFTRASNGTRVNSAGLVEVCPWNLVEYSEDFANAAWSKSAIGINTAIGTSGIQSNVVNAPNGTLTADRVNFNLQSDPDSGLNQYFSNAVAGQSFVSSIYVKGEGANIGKQIKMRIKRSSGGTFVGVDTTITLTADWVQVTSSTLTLLANNTGVEYIISSNDATNALIWGAQLNIGATAKPYFPTTDRLNVPRLTYQNGGGGGCPSLLLEKQSTNLVTYSEQFDQWSPASVTVTANNTTSPDGTQNADLITATSGSVHDVYNTFNGTTTNTVSIFVKKGTSQYIYISTSYQATTGDSSTILVDLDNKTLINSSSGNVAFVSGSIVEMGNGWLRVIYTTTAASATGMYIFAGISSTYTFNLTLYGRQVSSTTQTAYFWGAQCE